ncbi:MAG: purine-nucleoside phosphorylase, partial [Desulfobacteraceae bacterium]|nr:purine-nucleoside phosphorylase [Desulfobacteraceae bacterium]
DFEIEYSEIPYFPVSTIESHRGKLLFGTIEGKHLVVMQGRVHLYEGYSPFEVTFPIRLMQELNVKHLILSNASGGINLNFSAGDIMIIEDHINLTGHNPLIGHNEDDWGIRFPDMTQVYDKKFAALAKKIGKEEDIKLQSGVYAGLIGPSLETPAETRHLKTIGADAVGFSTVMEAITGVHAGMKIIGLATITNINNPDAPQKATLEEIIDTAQKASVKVNTLVSGILKNI